MIDFLKEWNWMITFVLSTALTIVIYRLTEKISFKSNFEHRAKIISETEKLLDEIYHNQKRRSKVTIVDISKIKKFPKDGYFNTEIERQGYNGVEFYWAASDVYKDKKGRYTLNKKKYRVIDAFIFGVIPYQNIESIELNVFDDEYENHAKIYCKFKWRFNKEFFKKISSRLNILRVHRNFLKWKCWKQAFSTKILVKSPYASFKYYKENKNYNKDNHHYSVKFTELF